MHINTYVNMYIYLILLDVCAINFNVCWIGIDSVVAGLDFMCAEIFKYSNTQFCLFWSIQILPFFKSRRNMSGSLGWSLSPCIYAKKFQFLLFYFPSPHFNNLWICLKELMQEAVKCRINKSHPVQLPDAGEEQEQLCLGDSGRSVHTVAARGFLWCFKLLALCDTSCQVF